VRDVLRRLTDTHEARRAQPWRMESLAEEYVAGMARAIVAFTIPVARLEGKFKLSQNRSTEDQAGVIAALSASDDATERDVAALMRAALG
jgi:transcriptional regulator